MILRRPLLPISLPSWIGCKASDAMAASVDGLVHVGEGAVRAGQRLTRRTPPSP